MIREGTELDYDPYDSNTEVITKFGNVANTNFIYPEGLYSDFSANWFTDIGG